MVPDCLSTLIFTATMGTPVAQSLMDPERVPLSWQNNQDPERKNNRTRYGFI